MIKVYSGMVLLFVRVQDAAHLHGFDDGDDACGPKATDGGEHGDWQVVVRGPPGLH